MVQEPQSHSVRRAVDIITVQLRCDEEAAFEALQSVAAAAEELLEDVAAHVLEGTVRFDA
jgi:AmiR/NasT family two-component response regulator